MTMLNESLSNQALRALVKRLFLCSIVLRAWKLQAVLQVLESELFTKAKGTVFGTETSATITPTQAVNYDVKVDVKDSTGIVAAKTFTVTVK